MEVSATYTNPYWRCVGCGEWVTGHNGSVSGRWFNVPCGHHADIHSACPTWGSDTGCQCREPKQHNEPPPR